MILKDAISIRQSVRTFSSAPIEPAVLEELKAYLPTIHGPWGEPMCRLVLMNRSESDDKPLGTYGVISGAEVYLGVIVANEAPKTLMSAGYVMEQAILKATTLGLGTCWLGGTFRREQFDQALEIAEDERIVAVSPVGYAADKKRFMERAMRTMVHSDSRKDFDNLFFHDNFETPYPEDGPLSIAFEAVRFAPSACNRQPWRLVAAGLGMTHFFAASDPGFQLVDMGIAMAHFDIARGFLSAWRILDKIPVTDVPKDLTYIVSAAM